MIILGIETSCDETAASICKDGVILSNTISRQIIHTKFGGVVPEIASREHEKLLNRVVNQTFIEAQINLDDLDAVAVTQGPGLAGTLLTGISFAKGLGIGLNIPVIPINHLEGHIFANFLGGEKLNFPFVCLLVSGGHTQLWSIKSIESYSLLGETRDDAAGEAFDKGARILGLNYPGGPEIEKAAIGGDSNKVDFPRILLSKDNLEFSFSGLKTSLLYFMDDFKGSEILTINDVVASYQKAIIDILVEKVRRALEKTGFNTCIISGGVAANILLREELVRILPSKKIVFPDLSLCTDNAAMISYLGEIKMKYGRVQSIDFKVLPNLKLN
ncbi:MAG: tRNA (adenosine(37)-N6)-threonylcarbamoyltransferase complex transferase subunit TsaD [Candidatus Neomarinimicrobiota bacterium]